MEREDGRALASMRYGDFTWPHNPQIYSIEYQRGMGKHKIPFGNYVLQDLGRYPRVMRGAGEFVGEGAYGQFGMLANMFYLPGPNWLVHPLWQASSAYFVDLKLEQVPRPNYVKYSFTFWEAIEGYEGKISVAEGTGDTGEESVAVPLVHTVVSGENLWVIARKYGLSLGDLIGMNPQIRNPNLIYPGNQINIK